jgi:enolase
MSAAIAGIDAFEILDSRGCPTLLVTVTLESGHRGTASVPSGASTGQHEAVELRDGDRSRYNGKGVLKAAANVRTSIARRLCGIDARKQEVVDSALIELDGTTDKSNLGANAILGTSMAVARAAAACKGIPLYQYLGGPAAPKMPVPMMNIINGGLHAENSLAFQEFMIVPHGAPSFAEAVRWGAEVFQALRAVLRTRGFSTAVGDEGGFAPLLASNEEACQLIVKAIDSSGLLPGRDVALALDPAATSFCSDGDYLFEKSCMSSQELLLFYSRLMKTYPIASIEDGFAEDDWEAFATQTDLFGDRLQVVGDDLYTTNSRLIRHGVEKRATNAVLIKLNQIGTLTETVEAIDECRAAGWNYIVSHRSGETEDTFIADFAVAMGGGQIKTGSLSRSERLAKYNRLIEIERELGSSAAYVSPFAKFVLSPQK